MKTLTDLLEHELQDLYSAENQLIEALPTMVKEAADKKLKKAFEQHLEETKKHAERIKEVCDELGLSHSGHKCKAMAGLIEEAKSFLKEEMTDEVKNAGMIAAAQRVEHYEIAGYGTAVRYAKELGHKNAASTLQRTLDEEYTTDEKLNDMAEDRLNRKAIK
ncbi:YciE/YciF ferroxidase family protein [Flavilitoribacter nigricans]|uniref:Uncharacterized protein n=1 Tax=Flavilitoribacter nigricans (strain ATCC 23147 / DSM 23189 / NBRC 102662 / NCIMB 1420 / SS-2) TaxID=1122177 RepID=A0A2D0N369_FLAN2|nr:ferritin-like domain-containing protein [Flavilitoribacter nigricans]PHN02193.1 hypothetical protein CRP01_33195 [Flavilitoribacter nigricans DSM 23189 = NBRC 102662]